MLQQLNIFPSEETVVVELESVLLSSCIWSTLGIFGLLIFGNLYLNGAVVVVFLPYPSTLIPVLFFKVSQFFGEPKIYLSVAFLYEIYHEKCLSLCQLILYGVHK